jgi:serine/threonine protein kinase/tetratricopeptide (TPR) repeat protein
MTPDRWHRIEQLFDALVDLPPDEQRAHLASECGGDQALSSDVERLLHYDRASGRRIAEIIQHLAEAPPPDEVSFAGRRLGAYRVIREIGRGGMGVVFEAVRDDDEFQKRVALKVAARAAYAPEFSSRFRHERQILARLEHPHIARLLDGGTTDEGVPFFAMEFVEGVPIHRYARERQLSIEGRIALMLQVCDAVEYAHQNLVIHRDLKPGNILVADGSVRLLDFGIAKLIDAAQPYETLSSLLPVTPEYCSPEQLRGQPITTRTDVYSLGLILYELLAGERAQSLDASSLVMMDRSIADTPLMPPSTRVANRGDRTLARRLRGDLDTIVLSATQPDPARRYPSVAALADDLRSHLASRPIRARQDSRWYRATRFVQRHWLPLAASVAVVITLGAGIAATAYQAQRAERRFEQVRGIANALMTDVHESIRHLPNSTRAQEVVVRTAVDYLDTLAQEAGSDRPLRLEIAQGYMKVGLLAYAMDRPSLGKPEEAQANYDKARTLLEGLRGAGRDDPQVEAAVSGLDRLHGELLHATGRATEALPAFQRAIATAEAALARHPDHAALLEALHDAQSAVMSQFEASQAARAASTTFLQVAERFAALSPATPLTLSRLAVAYSIAGKLAGGHNRPEEALAHYRRAVELQTKAFELDPASATIRRDLMLAWSNIADHELGPLGPYSYTGANGPARPIDPEARRRALEASRKVIEQAEWHYQRDPQNESVKLDYAMSLGRSAPAFPPGDREAIAMLEKSLAIFRDLEPTFRTRTLAFVIEFRGSLAERRRLMGDLDGAFAEWRALEGIIDAAIAAAPDNYYPRRLAIPVYFNWALTLARQGDRSGTRRLVSRLEQLGSEVAAKESQYARAPGWPPRIREWLAEIYEALGDEDRAQTARRESLEMWRALSRRTDLPEDLMSEAALATSR